MKSEQAKQTLHIHKIFDVEVVTLPSAIEAIEIAEIEAEHKARMDERCKAIQAFRIIAKRECDNNSILFNALTIQFINEYDKL